MNAPLLFDWRRDEARRASRRRQQARQRAQERQRRMDAIIALAAVIGLLLALGVGLASTPQHVAYADTAVTGDAAYTVEDFTYMSDLAWRNGNQCEPRFDWPVDDPQVEQQFERPINPWAPGHRGVDLVAEQGTVILSPQAGTVSFAGKVAGKDVVSVRHRGGVTSTFEPAVTELSVGDTISRRQPVGIVEGNSDHCEDRCLHWGLKRGTADYLDPQQYAGSRKIVLKPS